MDASVGVGVLLGIAWLSTLYVTVRHARTRSRGDHGNLDELRTAELNLRQLLDDLPDAVVVLARDGRIIETNANTVALTETSSEYLALFRDYRYAQSLFEVYSRFAEQIAVEALSADTVESVQIVEQPHIDPARHFNVAAVALLFALGLLAFVTEFYGPATGLIRRTEADGAV